MNRGKVRATGNELIDSVRDVFPNGSEIETLMDGSRLSFVCSICWKLRTDLARPNKPSKIILIEIPYEVIEDSNYNENKLKVNAKFKKFIVTKYEDFNPDHNEPRDKSPPNEIWVVFSNILL